MESIIPHSSKWLLSEHTSPTTDGIGSQRFNRREDKEIYCIQKKVEKCLKPVRSRWIIRQDWWGCQHSYARGFMSSPGSEGTIQGPSSPVSRQVPRVSGSDGQGLIHCPPEPRKRVPISLAPWLGITASRDQIWDRVHKTVLLPL